MTSGFTLSHKRQRTLINRVWSSASWDGDSFSSVVAIPACNEELLIERCLMSLSAQKTSEQFGVLVLVNGTIDATFKRVVRCGRRHRLPLCVIDACLPIGRRDAGAARCEAIRQAVARIKSPDVSVFTTDADSVPPSGWLATYGALLGGGYDMVAGTSALSLDDADDVPRSLLHREQMESEYGTLLDAIESCVDPVEHDPWPRHYLASGANLAIGPAGLDRLRHLRWPATGEDRYIVMQAETHGLRVRHDTECKVLTSGRIFGRARGGMADTMRRRILEPEMPCDERLEAVHRAYFRARMRRLCRLAHQGGPLRMSATKALSTQLALPTRTVSKALENRCFPAAWMDIERCSCLLRREPIKPGQLTHQSAMGRELILQLGASTPDEAALMAINL